MRRRRQGACGKQRGGAQPFLSWLLPITVSLPSCLSLPLELNVQLLQGLPLCSQPQQRCSSGGCRSPRPPPPSLASFIYKKAQRCKGSGASIPHVHSFRTVVVRSSALPSLLVLCTDQVTPSPRGSHSRGDLAKRDCCITASLCCSWSPMDQSLLTAGTVANISGTGHDFGQVTVQVHASLPFFWESEEQPTFCRLQICFQTRDALCCPQLVALRGDAVP